LSEKALSKKLGSTLENKKNLKKKGNRKKASDAFLKKEWYDVRAPTSFSKNEICHTSVNATVAEKLSSTSLKGRVFETNLADLELAEDKANKKFKFVVEDINGRTC